MAASTLLSLFKKAHGMQTHAFKNDPDHENVARIQSVHAGKGAIDIKPIIEAKVIRAVSRL